MRRLALVALLPFAVAACGAASRPAEQVPPGQAPAEQVLAEKAQRCAPGYRPLGSPKLAWVAIVRRSATAYRAPPVRGSPTSAG